MCRSQSALAMLLATGLGLTLLLFRPRTETEKLPERDASLPPFGSSSYLLSDELGMALVSEWEEEGALDAAPRPAFAAAVPWANGPAF